MSSACLTTPSNRLSACLELRWEDDWWATWTLHPMDPVYTHKHSRSQRYTRKGQVRRVSMATSRTVTAGDELSSPRPECTCVRASGAKGLWSKALRHQTYHISIWYERVVQGDSYFSLPAVGALVPRSSFFIFIFISNTRQKWRKKNFTWTMKTDKRVLVMTISNPTRIMKWHHPCPTSSVSAWTGFCSPIPASWF